MNKEHLKSICLKTINIKLNKLQKAIESYQNDLLSETKSSAGDKHETGRAMLQLEMEKLGQQYQNILLQKEQVEKINSSSVQKQVSLGSVVITNLGAYFIATSIGIITHEKTKVMVISLNSPIGSLLLGKEKGMSFVFNAQKIEIQEVC